MPDFNCYCPPPQPHAKRNTILLLVVSILVFSVLMWIVWTPSSPGAKSYGLETSYWWGLAVGATVMFAYIQSRSLYKLYKKTD